MSEPFVAEIRIFGFNFPPTGWAFCNGQLLPISQNTALFALIGTIYGGDGKSTFALPNLQDRTAVHPGQGPGLALRDPGESGGQAHVTLLPSEMPAHTHQLRASSDDGDLRIPTPARSYARSSGGHLYSGSPEAGAAMAPQALTPAGQSLPHNNNQPTLVLNYCIALQGIFPARN